MPTKQQHPVEKAAAELVDVLNEHNTNAARNDPAFLRIVVKSIGEVNDAGTAILSGMSPGVFRQRKQQRRPSSVASDDDNADTELDGEAPTLTTDDEDVDNAEHGD